MDIYIPKVKLADSNKTYVFLGLLDVKHPTIVEKLVAGETVDGAEMEKVLGKKWEKTILWGEKDVTYVNHRINANDTIQTFRKKLRVYLGLNNLYIWYDRQIKNDPAVIYHFITNIFRKSSQMRSEVFTEYVKTYFALNIETPRGMIDKREATKILFSKSIKNVKESLCFTYTFDGYIEYFNVDPTRKRQEKDFSTFSLSNSLSLLLNNFQVRDDLFYVIEKGASLYFPFEEQKKTSPDDVKLITTVEGMEKAVDMVDVPADVDTSTIVNYLHIKGENMGGNGVLNLEPLFNELDATIDVPFIKYKTPLNVFYKICKKSLSAISPEDIEKWTQISSTKDDKSFLIVKMRFNSVAYCSVSVNVDLSYNIKINISVKEGERISAVEAFLPKVNKLLEKISNVYPNSFIPLIPKDILKSSTETSIVRVVQIITSCTLTKKSVKVANENFEKTVREHMYPYFNVIENIDKSILHLQYKKVNNYTKFTNVGSFISMRYMMPRDDLVKQVEINFMMSTEEAEKEVDSWFAAHTMELEVNKTKLFIRPKNDSLVNIKIRLKNNIDLKYMVNGLTSSEMGNDIELLIKKLLVMSNQKIKKGVDASVLEKLEAKEPLIIQEVDVSVSVGEGEGYYDGDAGDDDEDAGDEVEDEDMKALLLGFEKELDSLNNNKKEELPIPVVAQKKQTKIKGYVLNKLYEADVKLFDYEVPPDVKRRDYASVCGWVDRRQPVVVSDGELDNINKKFPGAINGHVKSGSTAELQDKNNYICPKIWCPVSKVALSHEDYVKYGNKCPYPEIEEEPILFATKSFFGEGDAGLMKERYPGFLDKSIHPDKLCLPCCFKVRPDKGNRNKKRGDQCVPNPQQAQEEVGDFGKEKYILGTNSFPLESGRYGLLPIQLVEWLKQGDKQGNRHDGTGGMTEATNAVFRRGVPLSQQSYGEALVTVLDNPNISTTAKLYEVILDNIDVLTYIGLENGRIMKMFIDTTTTVYEKESFMRFYEWFKQQKKYILNMNLERLIVEIEEAGKTFDKDRLLHHQEVLREYIIYQSFMNFKEYLGNDRIAKEHLVLSDLISNNLLKVVNINRYNIVHMEYNADTEKIYFNCNVNKVDGYDMNYPFVFLLKRHVFYEPFVHVRLNGGSVEASTKFDYRDSNPMLKKIISFVTKNCVDKRPPLKNLMNYLKGIGYKVKYVVLDYGYKTCGLVLNQNIYLPLESREDFYYEVNIKYVYISDIPRFKCLMSSEDVSDLYKKVGVFLGSKSGFYNIKEFKRVDNKLIGFRLVMNDMFVPMNVLPRFPVTFKDGLFVLIGHEVADTRKEIYAEFSNGSKEIERLSRELRDAMDKNIELRREIEFLTDKHNPMPLLYKKEKIRELLGKTVSDIDIDDELLYKVHNRMKTRNGSLYEIRTRRFKFTDNEILLDHFDILSGRLKEEIEFAENPHKAFLNVVDDIENAYIFDDHKEESYEDLLDEDKYEDVPTKWRKALKGFKVIGNDDLYSQKYIYNILQRISGDIRKGHGFTDDTYYVTCKNKLVGAFESGDTIEILGNPWLDNYFKKKKESPRVDKVFEVYESVYYYPSTYDIKIMSQLAGLNLVLIGRKTMKNPDGLEVIYNNSDIYILMLYSYDRHKVQDKFNIFVNVKGKNIYFRAGDLPIEFKDIISKKMKSYDVEVEEDEE